MLSAGFDKSGVSMSKLLDEHRANAMKDSGHFSEAINLYKEIIDQSSIENWQIFVNLATCYLAQGEKKAALDCYYKALKMQPQNITILNYVGVFFMQEAQYEKAIKIFLIALQIDHNNLLIRLNLSSAYREIGDYQQALEEIGRIVQIKPDFAEAHNNKGIILMHRREYEHAEEEFKIALRINKDLFIAKSNMLFCSTFNPKLSSDELFLRHREKYLSANNGKLDFSIEEISLKKGGKLRLGYISPDFRNSSAAFFILPVLRSHDRHYFEVLGFGRSKSNDIVNNQIINLFDEYFVLDGLSETQIETLIKDCRVDFLIDLAGHTAENYLRALRNKPAKIQATTLGYAYTSGLSYMDYFIANINMLPENSERFYSEKLLRINALNPYSFPFSGGEVKPLPAKRNGFITFGCLSRSVRLNKLVITSWARILQLVPSARLLLNSCDFRNSFEQHLLYKQFEDLGIEKKRLSIGYDFPPWELYDSIDISLDCFPRNSGTTLIEGIFKGVPFITLCGELSMQRIGFSILKKMSLDEFVAFNVDQYVDIATRLSSDLGRLDFLRNTLRSRAKAVFEMNSNSYVLELEENIKRVLAG